MFTPLCFFCKGTQNYVYIDLKGSLSNLTLGQCKFDLRSMSKTSKLCEVVYHLTRLDGTRVFNITLWLLWIKRQLPQTEPMLRSKKLFLVGIYRKILMTSFFDLRFFDVLSTVEENYSHIWNPEEI